MTKVALARHITNYEKQIFLKGYTNSNKIYMSF